MHYYKRNIGDYAKKAGRLTMLQHGAYTLLLDACYDRERFPTLNDAIEWTWASSPAEVEAVQFVLSRFFTLSDGIYIQARIKQELAEFEERSATNSRIAREREAKRREKSTNRGHVVDDHAQDDNESPPTQYPLTTTQEPIPKEKRRRTPPPEMPEGVDRQTWADWLTLRAKKNAPVTQTVIKSAIKEAEKAGMHLEQFLQIWCARGSQGLEASWLKDSERKAARSNTPMSFAERDRENNIRRWEEMTGRTHPERDQQFRTIDIGGEDVLAIESN